MKKGRMRKGRMSGRGGFTGLTALMGQLHSRLVDTTPPFILLNSARHCVMLMLRLLNWRACERNVGVAICRPQHRDVDHVVAAGDAAFKPAVGHR